MIGVGLVGAGFIGRNHFNQYEKLADRVRIALCDKQAERRAGDWSNIGGNIADAQGTKRDLGHIKTYNDWHDLLADDDIDMVDICVPTHLHREITVAALAAGKHVLCEKPMALTVEDCDAMLAAAAESKGKLMIAQCIRFWPEYVYLKRVFDEGRLGPLKSLQLHRQAATPDWTLGNWNLDPKLGGGAVLDLHVHDVDYALWLLGKPNSVYARGYQRASGAVDRIHALWDYGREPIVQIEGFWDMPGGFAFNMGFAAVFERGAVVWDMNTGKPLTVYVGDSGPEHPQMPTADGYFVEITHFLDCIERDQPPTITTPRESRDAVAIALAEKESVQTGLAVIPQSGTGV